MGYNIDLIDANFVVRADTGSGAESRQRFHERVEATGAAADRPNAGSAG